MKLSRSLVPDLSALHTFDAAARHGSFTRAAAELNLTQSAVSRQIRELETRLGITLFERVRQRVILSDAGRHLHPEVQALLDGIERLALRAAGARDVAGRLTIATLPTFGSRWLMPRLPDFLSRHPGVQATVISRPGTFDLAAEGVDVAIHYGSPTWPGATCDYLCSEIVVPVVAPGLLDRQGADLMDGNLPLLHLESRPMLWAEWLASTGHEGRDAFRGHRFDSFSLLIAATKAGLGLALLPRYLIESELAEGSLHAAFDSLLATDSAYYAVSPEGHQSNPVCRSFLDWIAGQLGN